MRDDFQIGIQSVRERSVYESEGWKKSEGCPTRFFNCCRTRHISLGVRDEMVRAECPLPKFSIFGLSRHCHESKARAIVTLLIPFL